MESLGKERHGACAAFACVCIYSMPVYLNVFMEEAGAEPGLTVECWEAVN